MATFSQLPPSETMPLKGVAASRPMNWKEAEKMGWPAPTYESEELRKHIQHGFIRKVYSILCAQLFCTVGICYAVMAHPAINSFVLAHQGIMILNLILLLGLIFALHMYKNSYPLNLGLLAAFTVIESTTIATVCAHYEASGVGYLVGVAWGITLGIFVCLTLYVSVSKTDFSFLGLFLPACLMGMIGYSLVCMLFGWNTGYFFAFLGALLFSAFIVYDTDQIMNRMGCDDYVVACIELYLDIINLFLMILQLLGRDR